MSVALNDDQEHLSGKSSTWPLSGQEKYEVHPTRVTHFESLPLAVQHQASPELIHGAIASNESAHQFPKPVVVTSEGLLATDFPPRERLLAPWLLTQSLSMIYAPRGVGKTHVAMGVAYALASGGSFLGWEAVKPISVLYLDGEMPGADLRDRLERILRTAQSPADPDRLKFMTPDLQPDGVMPNLWTHAGRSSVTEAAADSKVIIVDNISALVRGGKENEGDSWTPVSEWALAMRASGRSVIFIHHAGKGGQQRGTSKREDVLDTVIAMRRPADYSPDQGARFEMHFEKARAMYGDDVAPLEATLGADASGNEQWSIKRVSDTNEERMIELAGLGMATRAIAEELGLSHSTVVRKLKEARAAGRLSPDTQKGGRPQGSTKAA